MKRTEAAIFLCYLVGLVGIFAALTLVKGDFYINQHEGDILHLTDIVLRMADGAWPHLDFVTPLGILSFAPMVGLVKLGLPFGQAALMSQYLVALALVPAIWWVAVSRLPRWLGYIFGSAVLIMVMSMVFGDTSPSISLSMHYNRWSWAVIFIAVPIAALAPTGPRSSGVDGVIIGLAMSFLVLCKITYAVAFAPALIAALVLRGDLRALWVALGSGLAAMAVMTWIGGIAFWTGYLGDLLLVSGTDVRPNPGIAWYMLVLAPAYLVGNLLLVAAITLFRKGEAPDLGLVLVLLFPACIYVTYQNFGNDPKWLALVALLLMMGGRSFSSRAIAVACAALIAPAWANMALSPISHLILKAEGSRPVFPAPHDDLRVYDDRMLSVMTQQQRVFSEPSFAALNAEDEEDQPLTWMGETLEACRQVTGMIGPIRAIAADLKARDLSAGKSFFVADTVNGLWMFGDAEPVHGDAPWYYGRLRGFENADYLMVPICPTSPTIRKTILEELSERPDLIDGLTEIRRTGLYILYAI